MEEGKRKGKMVWLNYNILYKNKHKRCRDSWIPRAYQSLRVLKHLLLPLLNVYTAYVCYLGVQGRCAGALRVISYKSPPG